MARWAWALLLVSVVADAHPLSRDRYSLRTALRLDADKLDALVVLEIPFDKVMAELKTGLDAAGTTAQSGAPAREVLDAYTAGVWKELGEGLILLADGRPVPGTWAPADSRYNGKGAVTEGFFIYIVEFKPTAPWAFGPGVSLQVLDANWPSAPMAYSAYVEAGKGWKVAYSSAARSLPDKPYDLNDPAFWVDDPAMRVLSVRFERAP